VVANPVAPFTRWERVVLTAWAAVGSRVLDLADALAPERHHVRHRSEPASSTDRATAC